jgi:hypothetical protein
MNYDLKEETFKFTLSISKDYDLYHLDYKKNNRW